MIDGFEDFQVPNMLQRIRRSEPGNSFRIIINAEGILGPEFVSRFMGDLTACLEYVQLGNIS